MPDMLNSKRLTVIADYVSQGARVADIGSDHALLPVELVRRGTSPSAVAGEVNDGPLEAARKGIAAAGFNDVIEARKGNGLEVLQPGEVDTVTIAGMGGALIVAILEAGRLAGKLEGVSQLVLQPNVGEELVREWLLEHGWYLAEEAILEEDGKYYEVMNAIRQPNADADNEILYGGAPPLTGIADEASRKLKLSMGPWLLQSRGEVFAAKWRSEIRKLRRIEAQMAQSELDEAKERREAFSREIATIEEVLACTPTDIS